MAVLNPRDWWRQGEWQSAHRRERSLPIGNQDVLLRWGMQVAFCFCFASLAPPDRLPSVFSALLGLSALGSALAAWIRKEHPISPHLTGWHESLFSLLLSLGVAVLVPAGSPGAAALTGSQLLGAGL
jgi:hypothetical protein